MSGSDNKANEMDAFAAFFPTSFGKQQPKKDLTKAFEKTKRKEVQSTQPSAPTTGVKRSREDAKESDATIPVDEAESEGEESDNEDNDEPEADELPISHEIILNDHTRTVSAMTLDPTGSRLITGGYDYEVKFWDFAGMNQSLKPFRSIRPFNDHPIHNLMYSSTGSLFLAISGSAQAAIYNRDGKKQYDYVKGDPYIRDLRHTDGHVGPLTNGIWHPSDENLFATSSQDGTLRIWNVENKRKQKDVIVHKSRERGGRSQATAIAYSPDAKLIAGAFQDGTINLWAANGPYKSPSITYKTAHERSTDTSSLLFSSDNHTLVSRGGDNTVKVWDIRNSKEPVNVANDLDIANPETNVIFSPDERLILTGTSCPPSDSSFGKLVMLDRDTLEIRRTMSVGQSSVVKVMWHPRLNQIITGSANGKIHVFYSPTHSARGAKLCVEKAPKQRAVDDYEIDRPVITPHALPMFKAEKDKQRTSKRKREKMRKDPKASHRPDLPVKGHGKGGRVGVTEQQQVIKSFSKDTTRDEDPREALLKYQEIAEKEPMWISNVYQKTQPAPVFAEDEEEEEEESAKK